MSVLESYSARIDTMILTHWDLDHYGGVVRLLTQAGCERFLYNHDTLIAQRDEERSKILSTLRQIVDRAFAHVELGPATCGVSGTVGNVGWTVLAPIHRHLTQAVVGGDRNLASGVLAIEAHGRRVIVGGDADSRVWKSLSARNLDLAADVLRYPHHGAMGPRGPQPISAADLLGLVQPQHTVFSVGTTNAYRHPLPSAVEAARGAGSRILCTQVTERCHARLVQDAQACAGDVTVYLDHGGITVSPTLASHDATISNWDRPMCRSED